MLFHRSPRLFKADSADSAWIQADSAGTVIWPNYYRETSQRQRQYLFLLDWRCEHMRSKQKMTHFIQTKFVDI